MASILRVNTLTDASSNNSTAVSVINQGTAKVWVNLNGTGTIALRDSYNVSGVTDNGTGNYTYAISSNMGNANYANTAMGNEGNAGDVMIDDNNAIPTTSAIRVQARTYNSGEVSDPDFIYHTSHGDLA
jgi:hypothetical protein